MVNAARKIGVTAVPLNYRLSPEEAAYVTDHCDATIVYVDAEFAPLFERIRDEIPKVEHILVFDGSAARRACSTPTPSWRRPRPTSRRCRTTTEPGATMIYTSGTTGKPKGAFRTGVGDPAQVIAMLQLIGYTPDDVYLTTGPALPLRPGRVHGHRPGARPDRRRAAQVRSRGLAASGRHLQGHVDLLGADADPDGLRAAGGGEGALRPLVDEAHDRQRRALELRPQADVPGRLPGRLALGGLRLDRARA